MMHMGSHRNTVQGGSYFRNGDAGVIVYDSDRNKVIGITSHHQSDGGVVLYHAHDSEVRGSDLRFNPSGVEAGSTEQPAGPGQRRVRQPADRPRARRGRQHAHPRQHRRTRAGGGGISLEGATFDALGNAIGGALHHGQHAHPERRRRPQCGRRRAPCRQQHRTQRLRLGHRHRRDPEIAGEPFPPSTDVDLGGNVASGNEILEQCTGLICGAGDAPPIAPPDITPPTAVIDEAPADGTGSTSASFAFPWRGRDRPTARRSPRPQRSRSSAASTPAGSAGRAGRARSRAAHPGEPPDIDEPPDGEGWVECTSPVTFHDLEEGEHLFQVRAIDFADLTQYPPTEYGWAIEPRPEDPEGPETVEPETPDLVRPARRHHRVDGDVPLHRQRQLDPGRQPPLRVPVRPARPGRRRVGGLRLAASLRPAWLPARTTSRSARSTGPQRRLDAGHADVEGHRPAARHDPAAETTIETGPDRTTVYSSATFTFSSDDPTPRSSAG